jgi:hypothetical protein
MQLILALQNRMELYVTRASVLAGTSVSSIRRILLESTRFIAFQIIRLIYTLHRTRDLSTITRVQSIR